MILVEATYWPLVVVGAIPDSADVAAWTDAFDEDRLWSTGDLRLAVVIPGTHARAGAAQEEVFRWLARHRDRLWRCVFRAAWIFEDEAMRQNTERWLTLVGDRLFRGEVTTFRSVHSALSWLDTDRLDDRDMPSSGSVFAQAHRMSG